MSVPPPITYPPTTSPGVIIKDIDVTIREVVASVVATPLYGNAPLTVTFDCTGSYGQRITLTVPEDEFTTKMDSPPSGWTITLTFTTAGMKTVIVHVTAGSTTVSRTLMILVNPPLPEDGEENNYVIRVLSFGSIPEVPTEIGVKGEMI